MAENQQEARPTTLADFLRARIAEDQALDDISKRRRADLVSGWRWLSESEERHVLRQMALLYADHPDYRPEWRP